MQPVNLPVGEFSRAEQRVLQSIFKAIAEGGGRCVATLETLARNSNTSKSSARNTIRTRSRNWPARKDRTPLLRRSLASQHFEAWAALAEGVAVGIYVRGGLVEARMAGI